MRTVVLASGPAQSAVLGERSLSALEKCLLRRGFRVEDLVDPSGVVLTVARRPFTDDDVIYPKPTLEYRGRDRRADFALALARAARVLGVSEEEVLQDMKSALKPQEGFSCRSCGACCETLGDAWRGRVGPEEVQWWRLTGRLEILRLVRRVEREAYSFYEAWVDPETGGWFGSCPWLRPAPGEAGRLCAIYEARPLKCRSFPVSRWHARGAGCAGFTSS